MQHNMQHRQDNNLRSVSPWMLSAKKKRRNYQQNYGSLLHMTRRCDAVVSMVFRPPLLLMMDAVASTLFPPSTIELRHLPSTSCLFGIWRVPTKLASFSCRMLTLSIRCTDTTNTPIWDLNYKPTFLNSKDSCKAGFFSLVILILLAISKVR
jgi:hypothetical protein